LAGISGKKLIHPIRIPSLALTLVNFFDKLIPLIEASAALYPGIPSIRVRVKGFVGV
jgi:hypothetical protein